MVDQHEPGTVLDSRAAGGIAVRGGTLRVAGYLLTALFSAASAAIAFRHLGVVQTGRFVTIFTVTAIVAGFSELGLTMLGVREYTVRDPARRAEMMRALIGLRLTVTVVGMCLAVGFSLLVGYGLDVTLGIGLAGLGLLAVSLQATLSVALMAQLRLGWVTAIEVGRQVVLAIGIAVLASVRFGLLPLVAVTIPAGLLALVVIAAIAGETAPRRPSFARRGWAALIRDGIAYSIATAAGAAYFRLSLVVVSLTASASALGYFGLSFRVLEVLIGIPALMMTSAFPIFAHSARDDQARLRYAVGRIFEVSLIVGTLIGILAAVGAPIAISVIGGHAFAPATSILRIQAVGLSGTFVWMAWGAVMLALQRQRALAMMSVAALLAGLVVVSLLAVLDGGQGAAIATTTTELSLAVAGAVALKRTDPDVLPSFRIVPKVAVAAGCAAGISVLAPLPAAPLTASAVAGYCLALWALSAIPPELSEQVRHLANRIMGSRSRRLAFGGQ